MASSKPKHRTSDLSRVRWAKDYFVAVPYTILVHSNYLTLTLSAQLIIIDFIRHYNLYTEFGRYKQPRGGIPYGRGHCIMLVHRNTFRAALNLIVERGFLEVLPQTDIDKDVRYYRWLSRWRKWQASPEQAEQIAELRARIIRRDGKDRASRACTFVVQSDNAPAQKSANPALNIWAHDPDYLHNECAAPHIDTNRQNQQTTDEDFEGGDLADQRHSPSRTAAREAKREREGNQRVQAARLADEAQARRHARREAPDEGIVSLADVMAKMRGDA